VAPGTHLWMSGHSRRRSPSMGSTMGNVQERGLGAGWGPPPLKGRTVAPGTHLWMSRHSRRRSPSMGSTMGNVQSAALGLVGPTALLSVPESASSRYSMYALRVDRGRQPAAQVGHHLAP